MISLAIRTDKPEAELYLYDDNQLIGQTIWLAHRELSATIHSNIKQLLESRQHEYEDIGGIVFFQGPGSFTGLRIGVSVANAFGSSLHIPVVAMQGDDWKEAGLLTLRKVSGFVPVEPFYGADAHITLPKK